MPRRLATMTLEKLFKQHLDMNFIPVPIGLEYSIFGVVFMEIPGN
jgi:hypothetical protein